MSNKKNKQLQSLNFNDNKVSEDKLHCSKRSLSVLKDMMKFFNAVMFISQLHRIKQHHLKERAVDKINGKFEEHESDAKKQCAEITTEQHVTESQKITVPIEHTNLEIPVNFALINAVKRGELETVKTY
ncbi:MAG: hypothetical protein QWI36_00780 [Wolbachia endosymbiont of Tyrophagus putrescentiae]|nr:hypothetical protein [Wolbachia endosymbiont of Tyrophagus putrescentiae]